MSKTTNLHMLFPLRSLKIKSETGPQQPGIGPHGMALYGSSLDGRGCSDPSFGSRFRSSDLLAGQSDSDPDLYSVTVFLYSTMPRACINLFSSV